MRPEECRRLAGRIVRKELGGDWQVKPISVETRDFELKKKAGRRNLSVGQGWDLAFRLQEHRDVLSAEPALVIPGADPDLKQVHTETEMRALSGTSGDDLACSQDPEWSLDLCEIQEAWLLAPPIGGMRLGRGIIVGHPDTGYTKHPEIFQVDRLLARAGYDFEDDDRNPTDPLVGKHPGHGTGTASVIMSDAGGSTALSVSGSAPKAKLVPLRVSTSVVHLSFRKVTKAIYYAADNGHHIISMSLGGPFGFRYLKRAIRYAIDKGLILLAAAGNVWPWVIYPARFDEVIAVAACNCRRRIWKSSAAGPAVDVTAPGESVWRALTRKKRQFEVGRSSGTSYAVATAAGVCALWLAFHGRDRLIRRYGRQNLASVFKETLIKHGVDIPAHWRADKHGAGILNARKMLAAPLPATPPAGGMSAHRAVRTPEPTSEMERLMEYFPHLGIQQVRRATMALLGSDATNVGQHLSEIGVELRFHVATNPELRAWIAAKASKPASRAASRARAVRPNLRGLASRALLRRISTPTRA